MPNPMIMVNITARGLSRARHIANELANIEAALDLPPEEREQVTANVGQDVQRRVKVPWPVVQAQLQEQRAAMLQELATMGINLLPPNPAEQDPNGIEFPKRTGPYIPKPQR